MTRVAMWVLLAVVAAAAAVLSFSALRDLAVLCGFSERLAWLLPVVIDAGAAAGCLVWLRPGVPNGTGARGFARSLTWTLLASSVAGNAIVHALTAYHLQAPWWLVVGVSAVAPAVLGAVVHLAVLVGRKDLDSEDIEVAQCEPPEAFKTESLDDPDPLISKARELLAEDPKIGRGTLARELGVSEWAARKALAETNGAGR